MIVKVQMPLASNEAAPPALVYSEGGQNQRLIAPEELPRPVREAAKGGKAYFYVQVIGGVWKFGAQAPAQDW